MTDDDLVPDTFGDEAVHEVTDPLNLDAANHSQGHTSLMKQMPWPVQFIWFGSAGYLHIDDNLILRVSFANPRTVHGGSHAYDSLLAQVINRQHGLVIAETFRIHENHTLGATMPNLHALISYQHAHFKGGNPIRTINLDTFAQLCDRIVAFGRFFARSTTTRALTRRTQPDAQGALAAPGAGPAIQPTMATAPGTGLARRPASTAAATSPSPTSAPNRHTDTDDAPVVILDDEHHVPSST